LLQHIPNLITFARIALVLPVVLAISMEHYQLALVLFAIAGSSDGIDGYLARKFNWTSRFGEAIDPAADKLLLAATAITLTVEGHFPVYLLVLFIVRDLMIVAGAGIFYLLTGPFQVTPSGWGKLSTVLQIFLLLSVMVSLALPTLELQTFKLVMDGLILIGCWVVAMVGLFSGFTYLWFWTLKLTENPGWKR